MFNKIAEARKHADRFRAIRLSALPRYSVCTKPLKVAILTKSVPFNSRKSHLTSLF